MTTNQSIKAIVFDLGKVLVDFDYSIAIRKIAARSTISVADLSRSITTAPLLLDYECGKLTSEEFFVRVRSATGFQGDIEEFANLFGNIFSPIEPMIDLHRSLSGGGFPTFIFSNTNDLAVRHIRKTFPFFNRFSGYVLSYEHGSMKPAAEFYRVLEQQSGFRGPEIFYLDDRPENVAAGAARGWQAVVHQTPEETIRKVRALGLLGGDSD
ncbi:MAG TPA: HAD family phosphatase [Verrucomicrobiae bacterium]